MDLKSRALDAAKNEREQKILRNEEAQSVANQKLHDYIATWRQAMGSTHDPEIKVQRAQYIPGPNGVDVVLEFSFVLENIAFAGKTQARGTRKIEVDIWVATDTRQVPVNKLVELGEVLERIGDGWQ